MQILKNVFWDLTIRLELFTMFLPIPSFVYFIMTLGAVTNTGAQSALLSGFICGGYTVVWGIWIRYTRLKKLFEKKKEIFSNKYAYSEVEFINLKKEFLKYPFKESRTIVERWVAGAASGALVYYLLEGQLPIRIVLVELYSLIFVLPISYIMYLIITEFHISRILRYSEFVSVEVPDEEIKEFGYFNKIVITLFSIVIVPSSILGFFLFMVVSNVLIIQNPVIPILVIGFLSSGAIVYISYVLAKNLKDGFRNANHILSELGKKNFNMEISRSSCDEFGRQEELLQGVIYDLRYMYKEITNMNQNLEAKVKARTLELEESLEVVNALKKKQDGDYFLTSLLLKPLSRKSLDENANIKIDFLIHQKKEFEFNKRNSEIGGDICRTDQIRLRNKEFAVFINADAMGKSIQGAGGAIVLGAVFDSIIQRTKLTSLYKDYYPEKWMKTVFIELHKVFLSFDCTMLVSCVLGLVDMQTGFMYYTNAEHPFTIIYRDGKASFLDKENMYYKLGTTMADNRFVSISTFQIMSYDTIINGSDGRDDIIPKGNSLFESDENRILPIVERASGKINNIVNLIKEEYTITDDLSLLSCTLKEGFLSPFEKWSSSTYNIQTIQDFPDKENLSIPYLRSLVTEFQLEKNPYILKAAGISLFQLKDYNFAANTLEKYLNFIPSDNDTLYYCSIAYRKSKLLDIAIDMGERLRTRDSNHIKNLKNLAFCYKILNNIERLALLCEHIKVVANPEDLRTKRFINRILR